VAGAAAAAAVGKTVQLSWQAASDPDVAGFEVFRSATPGGPYDKLTTGLLVRSLLADTTAPLGVPSYYIVRAVDTSGNESDASPEVSATPG
jgi:hypothetical protein